MEGILRFKLPQEKVKFEAAQNGTKMKESIFDFDEWLRNSLRDGNSNHIDIYDCRQKLRDICYDNGINIEGETIIK